MGHHVGVTVGATEYAGMPLSLLSADGGLMSSQNSREHWVFPPNA